MRKIKKFITKIYLILFVIICYLLIPFKSNARDYFQTIYSPSKLIKSTFILNQAGFAYWNVIYKGDTLINNSSLGFILKSNDSLMRFRIIKSSIKNFNENWKPVWGQSLLIHNEYNELKVELKDFKGRILFFFMRAYNDGFAFRYEIPNQNGITDIIVTSEESRISFNGKYECWWSWADYNTLEKLFYHTILDSASHVATPLL